MNRVLFLGSNNSCRSQMAAAFARAVAGTDTEVSSAGIEKGDLCPAAVSVMAEAGIDIAGQVPRAVRELTNAEFDVVIAMDEDVARRCPSMPGHPEVVNWRLDPAEGSVAVARVTRETLQRLVHDLFRRGYLEALVAARTWERIVLDNTFDGIIAHDSSRKITYFNRAAEALTGYTRAEVLNRDCHEVFPGNFCGGKCLYCDESHPEGFGLLQREVEVVTKSGDTRTVAMLVKEMTDDQGRQVGVMVSFRDVTREQTLARRAGEVNSFSGIVGRDKKMLEVFDLVRELAAADVPVLVHGESGTGKELVAAAIHNEGPRAGRLFVPVNCGALPETLLESELFGHVKGAFTGALRDKKGRFELADGGTIFLDEIGDISPAMQVKLLRVLQDGTFERLGSERTTKVNVRIISASNKDLSREISEGRFREDLFYRLSVVPITIPPLRERRNDIPLLAQSLLERFLKTMNREGVTLSPEALDIFISYDWPGNVRELQNWIQFALVKCHGPVILPDHLPPARHRSLEAVEPRRSGTLTAEEVLTALRRTRGNRMEAARVLGVSRATLYRFMDRVGLGAGDKDK